MMIFSKVIWIFLSGCLILVFAQPPLPPGFNLPPIMQVERNWYARSTDPIGTVVTKVHREKTDDKNTTFGLETTGPPAPFEIDPHTGVVKTNDTLIDKENQSFSLWVTADGSIPQKTEVLATITDDSGQRPKLPIPPFQLPKLPPYGGSIAYPPYPLPTKTPRPQSTTKATEKYLDEVIVPETTPVITTLNPPKRPDDLFINIIDHGEKTTNISEPTEEQTGNDVPITVIPLVAIAGLVVIVAAVIFFVWKRNNTAKSSSKKDDMLSEETTITKEDPTDEWEFPRHRLRIFNIVGEGAFGQVWRAQAIDIDGKKGEQTVAVKTLKENASEKEKSDLLQELLVMKNLGPHPNVVRLIACCTEKEPTFVIMEFVSLGKLQQFLRDSRAERHYGNTHGGSQFLTSRDLTHFAFQVARGMDFLSSKGIIHRDLAARNVLITEERTCKVADFGFARDVGGTHVYERKSDGRLPIRWMAPESLYDDIFSVKSDIWSFGVLLWEIVTLGSTPYPGLSAGDVMRKVRDGYRLEKPEHCRRELYNIMYYCWEAEPPGRPDFKEVVAMLEKLLCTETDYIELERFPDHSYYNLQELDGEKV
ncbi:tyrosine kinase receptor Cad96Ca isoform X2 [Plodia interpunctella]|uniref:tyrosine kinase receptor Cad96Ca isoform X2 n=1 Tax=Plodia interpunctella TaxID=58824 RepID=UPI002367A6FB|nr:tyrosine kinase receptor Cad96Ca isoform X2 [Plodia interpunctella]XP_053603647.1 tyrosine kinase receptor Cad96Ca isoform X2 [Plodia interpunctella]